MIWETQKVGDLPVKIIDGDRSAKYPKKSELTNEGYLFLNSTNIRDNYLELDRADYVTPEKFATITKGRLESQDIIMTTRGSVGKVALFNSGHSSGLINAQMLIFRSDDTKFSQKFLFYTLTSNYFQDLARNFASGSAQPQLPIRDLRDIFLPVPPLETQRQIAAILSAYDDLIENNARRIKVLEEMAGLIYREWFVNFRFPGHQGVRRVDSELGEIPEGWEVGQLQSFCRQVVDGTHDSPKPADEGYFLVTGRHIENGFINFANCYRISPDEHRKVIARSKPEQGDIIFSNIGTLGSTVLVDQEFEFSIKNVALFKPLKPTYSPFLFLLFSSPATLELMFQQASGTSQKFFGLKFLREYRLVRPPEEVVEAFAPVADPLLALRSSLYKQNQNLRRTRDLLLPKLISGELDVSQLGADPEDVQDLADLRAAKAAEGDSPALSLDELKLELERG